MPGAFGAKKTEKKAPKTDYAADMKAASKKGDKAAFYTAQRKRAEKTGDTKTTDKIAGKLRNAPPKKKGGSTAAFPSGTDDSTPMSRGLSKMKSKPSRFSK